MPIIFKPYGQLDVSTDPSQLSQNTDENGGYDSGAMTRCKNLRLNEGGIAKTRDGSTVLNAVAMDSVGHIVEQDGYRYSFGETIYRDEAAIDTGNDNINWSTLLYNAFNSTEKAIFALNGVDMVRIAGSDVYAWGITAPATKPTLSTSGTGLTGDYNAKYTYARLEGSVVVSESNPSLAATSARTLSNQGLSVTVTAPTDPQVTHIRLYRTLANGLIYYLDQTVAYTQTTIVSTTADSALGTALHSNHDTPPAGSVVLGPNYDGACFILKDNLVYFCMAKQPEYWPAAYYVEVGPLDFPLMAGCFWNGQLYVASKHDIYLIAGTGPQTYFPYSQNALTGARGRYCMLPVKGMGIIHVGHDGLYLFSTGSDKKLTQGLFDSIFRGQDSGAMPGVGDLSTSWLVQYGNNLYFGYASKDNTYPQHVINYDLSSSKMTYYDWGIEIPSICVDRENERLLAVDTDGYVWHLENKDETTDNDAAIEWDIQSKDFTLSTRAHFPRWSKYDIDASLASATGELVLDGVVHQQHTITGNRQTKRRLIKTGNGQKCALRVHGSGPVSIYAVESE